jgi:ABC-type nitrate/sulfonate/bicarbonate transport system substrate-binding protein
VFTDIALAFVRDIAPELYAAMTRNQEVHDAMRIVHRGPGDHARQQHMFTGWRGSISCARCASIARRSDVAIEFGRRVDDIGEFGDCDLVVAADGAGQRDPHALPRALRACARRAGPNLLAWYGTTALFDPLSLIFREDAAGLPDRARLSRTAARTARSSSNATRRPGARRGSAGCRRRRASPTASRLFRDDLDGQPLLSNRSEWFRYAIVSNRRWYRRNLGAARRRAAHRSSLRRIGHALAMQDAIALFEACVACAHVPTLLADFERRRRPGSDALQDAAIRAPVVRDGPRPALARSGVVRLRLPAPHGRVEHQDVRARDPALAARTRRCIPKGSVRERRRRRRTRRCVCARPRSDATIPLHCARRQDHLDKISIRFTLFSAFYSPLISTMSGGFLKAEGLEPQWSISPPGRSALAALVDGAAHVVQSALSQGFTSLKQGRDTRRVHFAQVNEMDGFFLTGRDADAAFTWDKLEGAEVVMFNGGSRWRCSNTRATGQESISTGSEPIFPGGAAEIDQAFRRGQGQYVQQQGPFPQQLQSDGIGHIVAQVGQQIGPCGFFQSRSNRDWLKTDMAKAFMRAYKRTRTYLNEAPAAENCQGERNRIFRTSTTTRSRIAFEPTSSLAAGRRMLKSTQAGVRKDAGCLRIRRLAEPALSLRGNLRRAAGHR